MRYKHLLPLLVALFVVSASAQFPTKNPFGKKKQPAADQSKQQPSSSDKSGDASDDAGKGKDKDANGAKKDEPAPLFGGSVDAKSSKKSQDVATLGFNGIGPNGEIDKKTLDKQPTGADEAAAAALANVSVDAQELQQFAASGNLPAPKETKQ